jgi:hypothetical protein
MQRRDDLTVRAHHNPSSDISGTDRLLRCILQSLVEAEALCVRLKMSDDEPVVACCDVGVYEAWRKNIPWTYDWITSHFMEWGSLSAEWLGQRPLSKAAKLRLRSAANPGKLQAVSSLLGKMGAAEAETVMKGAYSQGLVMTTRTGTQPVIWSALNRRHRCCRCAALFAAQPRIVVACFARSGRVRCLGLQLRNTTRHLKNGRASRAGS